MPLTLSDEDAERVRKALRVARNYITADIEHEQASNCPDADVLAEIRHALAPVRDAESLVP